MEEKNYIATNLANLQGKKEQLNEFKDNFHRVVGRFYEAIPDELKEEVKGIPATNHDHLLAFF